jgi:hypothetical protein
MHPTGPLTIAPGAAVLLEYRLLLERGYTECAALENSGPEHGERGEERDEWMAVVAGPWFDAMTRMAAEDGVGITTYQGFQEYIPGSTPCAYLHFSSHDRRSPMEHGEHRPRVELLAETVEAVQAALRRRWPT